MISKLDQILLTGATGLIGGYTLRRLLQEGYTQIRAIKRPTSRMDLIKDIQSQVEWIDADVTDMPSLERAMVDVKCVIHAAAVVSYDPVDNSRMEEVNVQGTTHVVDWALHSNVERLIHVSSVAALGYDRYSHIRTEETEWDHSAETTAYARSKYKSEKEIWRAAAEGLDVVILNPSFVLGAGYWNESSTAIWRRIRKGIPFFPVGTNGYVDVSDVADAIVKSITTTHTNHRYIISAETMPYQHLFAMIARSISAKVPTKPLTKRWRGLAWKLDWLRSKLSGQPQVLTAASARSTALNIHYDATKSVEMLNMDYVPVSTSINRIAAVFLKSEQEGLSYGVIH